jgi:hypothetical protein
MIKILIFASKKTLLYDIRSFRVIGGFQMLFMIGELQKCWHLNI